MKKKHNCFEPKFEFINNNEIKNWYIVEKQKKIWGGIGMESGFVIRTRGGCTRPRWPITTHNDV